MMAISTVKILLIEDSLAEARLLQEFLKQAECDEFTLIHVKRLGEALEEIRHCAVNSCEFDVILLDLTLPDSQGLASLPPLISLAPSLPIVVLTNTNDEKLAIEAVRQGAQDYLVKRQVNLETLMRSMRYAIERKHNLESLRTVNEALQNRVQEQTADLVKAKEINQFKSEFVSILSHDIRNPLNAILLAAGLLKNSDEKLPIEKKTAHYQLIATAVKNMVLLLDEASFIGKADSGKLQFQLVPLDLGVFCSQLIEDAKLATNEKGITVIFTIQGKSEESLWDEISLRHILSNLLNNAIKYSPDNSNIIFELIYQDSSVIFKIKDQGIGIPPEDQAQLFDAFHRASNVGKIPGTGLGLSIVKKCVDAYGGEISVSSQVGAGATFTVVLPLIG
jgi:signal transduction histidine kinase